MTAPLFVKSGTGLNDDLNGIERPVSFPVKDMNDQKMEIVQSLAKWKRLKVTQMGFQSGFGIYTDMNAIRPDEDLDAIHSLYVDQWDWCMAMDVKNRTVFYLHSIVNKIYRCLKQTEFYIYDRYPEIKPVLPEEIKILYADDLQKEYPSLTPKQREYEAAKKYGNQCVVLSMDVARVDGKYRIFAKGGREDTGIDALDWAMRGEQNGAGELVLNSIDTDGVRKGFDLEMLEEIGRRVSIPLIASGGAGKKEDFKTLFELDCVDAGLAAGIFHSKELIISDLKKYLKENGVPVRI